MKFQPMSWNGGRVGSGLVGAVCVMRSSPPPPAGWPWARPCLHLAALLVGRGAKSSFPGLSSEPLSVRMERGHSSLIAGLGARFFQVPKVEAPRTIRCNIY